MRHRSWEVRSMMAVVSVLLASLAVVFVSVGTGEILARAIHHRRRVIATRAAETRRWRPPYVSGRELYSWARSMAADIVGDSLQRGPDACGPAELTHRLHRGTSAAMLPGVTSPDALGPVPCPRDGQGVIGISAPEVIQLAEYLRRRLSSRELRRVRDRCERSEGPIGRGPPWGLEPDPCLLQGDAFLCVAYGSRPLACRPHHAAILAMEMDMDLASPGDPSSSMVNHMEMIGFGVSEGLAQGLSEAGVDANTYELHSALAVAIDRSDAAERWAAGEDLFAGCRRVRSGPSPTIRPDRVEDDI